MRSAQDAEAVVRHLQNRLKIFEKHQADKKLPASLRKQLTATELELLKAEYGHVSDVPARRSPFKERTSGTSRQSGPTKNPPRGKSRPRTVPSKLATFIRRHRSHVPTTGMFGRC